MARSYRGLGLVVLVVLVVAPLALFAVLALFEQESGDSIKLSLDGVHWSASLQGALLASPRTWSPGESRSAIVYVRNGGPDPVDADVLVTTRSTDDLVRAGHLTLSAQVGDESDPFDLATTDNDVPVTDLQSEAVVPVTLSATFADTAPIGSSVDSAALIFRLRVTGARTEEAGAPSLIDATGAQLWLAPVFLLASALVSVFLLARRRVHRPPEDRTGP